MTKLHKLRVEKGLTQNALSKFSGVPKRTLENYEYGRRPIDTAKIEYLAGLCIALNCNLEDIIESEETVKKLKELNKKLM